MFKRTRSLSNAICNTHKIFLSKCSWRTKKFRVTWSHNSTYISSHIEDNGCQNIGVTTLTCQGHVTFPVTWPFDSPGAISYKCSIVTESLSPTIFEIMGIFYNWVTTLTFLGHVTTSVTWPFDSPGAISYRCSIVTESLFRTIFEIMDIFYIWVTTLTFLGQVTSLFTWTIDPPYVISYWCPIVNEPLSLTVFEIFGPQNLCAHTDTHTETQTHAASDFIFCPMQCIAALDRQWRH